jgi:two-component system, chemotaxis family, chemotaxis protein CheY
MRHTPTALVVDDSAYARRVTVQVLESLGFHVVEAENGVQALERYYIRPSDIVVLDMVMPGLGGLEVLTQLRALNEHVYVIVSTADVQNSTARQVASGGAVALINKPITREKLVDALAKRDLESGPEPVSVPEARPVEAKLRPAARCEDRQRLIHGATQLLLDEQVSQLEGQGWTRMGEASIAKPSNPAEPPYWTQAMALRESSREPFGVH